MLIPPRLEYEVHGFVTKPIPLRISSLRRQNAMNSSRYVSFIDAVYWTVLYCTNAPGKWANQVGCSTLCVYAYVYISCVSACEYIVR